MPTWVEKVDALPEVPHLDQVAGLATSDNDRSGGLLVVDRFQARYCVDRAEPAKSIYCYWACEKGHFLLE